jgi:hypothetical protein
LSHFFSKLLCLTWPCMGLSSHFCHETKKVECHIVHKVQLDNVKKVPDYILHSLFYCYCYLRSSRLGWYFSGICYYDATWRNPKMQTIWKRCLIKKAVLFEYATFCIYTFIAVYVFLIAVGGNFTEFTIRNTIW